MADWIKFNGEDKGKMTLEYGKKDLVRILRDMKTRDELEEEKRILKEGPGVPESGRQIRLEAKKELVQESLKRPGSIFKDVVFENKLANGGAKEEKTVHHVQFNSKEGKIKGQGQKGFASPSISTSTTSSSEDNSSLGQFSEARPPDGGWGWVIVAASFMVNLIADGVTFSFGVIYVEFLKYFGEGKSKTAWIGSLFIAMPMISGPVASFLTDR